MAQRLFFFRLSDLEQWEREGNEDLLRQAEKRASECSLCNVIWNKFVASKKQHQVQPQSAT